MSDTHDCTWQLGSAILRHPISLAYPSSPSSPLKGVPALGVLPLAFQYGHLQESEDCQQLTNSRGFQGNILALKFLPRVCSKPG